MLCQMRSQKRPKYSDMTRDELEIRLRACRSMLRRHPEHKEILRLQGMYLAEYKEAISDTEKSYWAGCLQAVGDLIHNLQSSASLPSSDETGDKIE